MAYILVVNPTIHSAAGMPREVLVTDTALGAALATLLMAFLVNLPLALAPGMGREHLTPFTCGLALVFLLHFLEPLMLRWLGHWERMTRAPVPPTPRIHDAEW